MKIKNFFNSIFTYTPTEHYHFTLPEENNNSSKTSQSNIGNEKIYPSLSVNIEYMQTKYNVLINSDIILREFTLNARGKQYNAFVFYIDGMVDSKIMDEFILQPLMLRNKNNLYDSTQNKVISEAVANNNSSKFN